MSQMRDQEAALLALVLHRPDGRSARELTNEVVWAGDALGLWRELRGEDLFGVNDELSEARQQVEDWVAAGYQFVSILDPGYPSHLRGVYDAPPFLFHRGDMARAAGGVSIVGSRDASPQACARAARIAELVVQRGLPVISGLARGIDSAAHEATIEADGVPVGVIATGIAAPYTPASSRPLHEKVARTGVLVSQFMPTAPAQKHTFLMRNATMSGLGLATIVVEAGEHSGARAQARMAMEHGRPVLLTDSVITNTQWARELADGRRPNVYPVGGLQEVSEALDRIAWMTSDAVLDQVIPAG